MVSDGVNVETMRNNPYRNALCGQSFGRVPKMIKLGISYQIPKGDDHLTVDVKITSLQGHFPDKSKGFERMNELFQ
ncbi:hypothetical protein TNCV_4854501 [Trichonephila clavipes]|nr:hypothetical protein TNCV_4854501 [Trichonephila clavipes]